MPDSYLVRGGVETVAEEGGTASEIKQAAKEVKDVGTVDASFSRGKLFLLEDEAVFAPSINESSIGNLLDNSLFGNVAELSLENTRWIALLRNVGVLGIETASIVDC